MKERQFISLKVILLMLQKIDYDESIDAIKKNLGSDFLPLPPILYDRKLSYSLVGSHQYQRRISVEVTVYNDATIDIQITD